MKRFVFIALLVLVCAAGGALIYLSLNREQIVLALKPRIERALGGMVSGTATIDTLEFELVPRARAVASGVHLQGSRKGRTVKVTVPRLELELSLLPLLSQELKVERLIVERPNVAVGPREPEAARAAPAPGGGAAAPRERGQLLVNLDSVLVREGTLEVAGRTPFTLERVHASAGLRFDDSGLVLTDPAISGRIGDLPTIALEAATLVVPNGSGRIQADELKIDLAHGRLGGTVRHETEGGITEVHLTGTALAIDELGSTLSRLGVADLPALKGDLSATINGFVTGFSPLSGDVKAEARVSSVAGAPYGLSLENGHGTFSYELHDRTQKVIVPSVTAELGAARSVVTVNGEHDLTTRVGTFHLSAPGAPARDASEILARFVPRSKLTLTSGIVTPDLTFELSPQGAGGQSVGVQGRVGFEKATGTYAGTPLRGVDGEVLFENQGGSTVLKTTGLNGGVTDAGVPLSVRGEIALPQVNGQLSVSSAPVELSAMSSLVRELAPGFAELHPSGIVTPQMNLRFSNGRAEGSGTAALSNGSLTLPEHAVAALQGRVEFTIAGQEIEARSEKLEGTLDGQRFTTSLVTRSTGGRTTVQLQGLQAFEGRSNARVTKEGERLQSELHGEHVSLEPLLSLFTRSNRVAGLVDTVDLTLAGRASGDALRRTLEGDGRLAMSHGVLRGVNIARVVIERLNELPLVGGLVLSRIPPTFGRYLEPRDTPINRLKATVAVRGGTISTNDLIASSDLFDLEGQATLTSDDVLKVKARLLFNREFSDEMAHSVPQLRRVLGQDARLEVPLTIEGPTDQLRVLPDFKRLAEGAAGEYLRGQAERALDRFLRDRRPRE